mmetsp:Transcript_7633/g.6758  ORF Transcript_7633/g.6758 Transcript_7633/m.6758 type:complete len:161 (-) Transcript_7633:57-539(-)
MGLKRKNTQQNGIGESIFIEDECKEQGKQDLHLKINVGEFGSDDSFSMKKEDRTCSIQPGSVSKPEHVIQRIKIVKEKSMMPKQHKHNKCLSVNSKNSNFSSMTDTYLEELKETFTQFKRRKSRRHEMIDFQRKKMNPSYSSELFNSSHQYICTNYDIDE